jgi:hypothetical protein
VKALANDQEQLCDESGIAKVRHQIGLRGCSGKELAFVILSPNFCAKTGGIKTRKIGPQVAYCLGLEGLETGGMPS